MKCAMTAAIHSMCSLHSSGPRSIKSVAGANYTNDSAALCTRGSMVGSLPATSRLPSSRGGERNGGCLSLSVPAHRFHARNGGANWLLIVFGSGFSVILRLRTSSVYRKAMFRSRKRASFHCRYIRLDRAPHAIRALHEIFHEARFPPRIDV